MHSHTTLIRPTLKRIERRRLTVLGRQDDMARYPNSVIEVTFRK